MNGNPNVDWSCAPADADGWEVTDVGVAVWTKIATLDVTTIHDTDPKAGIGTIVAGNKPAPMFDWTGDWRKSYTSKPT